jgi:hypothetical protein
MKSVTAVEPTTAPAIMTPAVSEPASIISTAIVATTPVAAASPISVIPRASADKDSAIEPVRAVVAVGRTGIRVIIIVAVSAYRSWTPIAVTWADSNADNYSLRVREGSEKHANDE